MRRRAIRDHSAFQRMCKSLRIQPLYLETHLLALVRNLPEDVQDGGDIVVPLEMLAEWPARDGRLLGTLLVEGIVTQDSPIAITRFAVGAQAFLALLDQD